MIIPDEYIDQAIDKGYATVEILALGKEKKGRGAKSFYVPMNQVEQVRYMNANKNDRPLIMEAQRKQNEAFASLRQNQPAAPATTSVQSSATKPATTPKKATTPAVTKQPAKAAAAKPPAQVKVKTSKEQESDARMKKLMEGK
jgi:hypothetical protein